MGPKNRHSPIAKGCSVFAVYNNEHWFSKLVCCSKHTQIHSAIVVLKSRLHRIDYDAMFVKVLQHTPHRVVLRQRLGDSGNNVSDRIRTGPVKWEGLGKSQLTRRSALRVRCWKSNHHLVRTPRRILNCQGEPLEGIAHRRNSAPSKLLQITKQSVIIGERESLGNSEA